MFVSLIICSGGVKAANPENSIINSRLYKNLTVMQIIQYISLLLLFIACIFPMYDSTLDRRSWLRIVFVILIFLYFCLLNCSEEWYENFRGNKNVGWRDNIVSIILTGLIVIVLLAFSASSDILNNLGEVLKILMMVVYILDKIGVFDKDNRNNKDYKYNSNSSDDNRNNKTDYSYKSKKYAHSNNYRDQEQTKVSENNDFSGSNTYKGMDLMNMDLPVKAETYEGGDLMTFDDAGTSAYYKGMDLMGTDYHMAQVELVEI
jgi:hypothetical protein